MSFTATEFESLYKRCFPSSMHLAISLLHDVDEARDVVHEVFVRLWESKIRIDNPDAFLIKSVRNAALNRISTKLTREKIHRKIILEPPADDFDYEERGREVKAAIRYLLTPRERQVVDKVYSEGLSYKQSAEYLGVSEAAINKNIVSSLKKLRHFFKNK